MTIRIDRTETPDIDPTVVLFALDDKEYHVSSSPRPNVALKYLRLLREEGEGFATAYLLEALLGKEGFKDLSEYDNLKPDQFRSVMKAARELTMSSVEADKS